MAKQQRTVVASFILEGSFSATCCKLARMDELKPRRVAHDHKRVRCRLPRVELALTWQDVR